MVYAQERADSLPAARQKLRAKTMVLLRIPLRKGSAIGVFSAKRGPRGHQSNGKIMNRAELTKKLADDAQISPDEACQVLDVFVQTIKHSLLQGKRVEIRGFGSFKIKEYEPYTGRNPRTGESVEVKGKRMPLFRAGKELKKLVNS